MFNLHLFKKTTDSSRQERLIVFAKQAQDRAVRLPVGPERDALLQKARRADTAAHLDDWLSSPGLRPPT